KVVREDPVQAQRPKTKRDCGHCSLRGVSAAPEWHTDPVAKFRVPVRFRNVESHRTAELAPGPNRNGKRDGTPRAEILICLGKKALGVVRHVWVRNVQSRSGDFVCSSEAHDSGNIFALEGAKQQAGGPQFLRSGHETSLRETHFYVRTLIEGYGIDEAHLAFVQGDHQRVRADAFAEEANAAQEVPFGNAGARENDFLAGCE